MFQKFNSITLMTEWWNIILVKNSHKTLLSLLFVSESLNKDTTTFCAYYSGARWIHNNNVFNVPSISNQMDHHRMG